MEDFILREIDRLGEMLMLIARRLGLLDGDTPDYSLADVKDEFGKAGCPMTLTSFCSRRILSGILWKPGRFQTTVWRHSSTSSSIPIWKKTERQRY